MAYSLNGATPVAALPFHVRYQGQSYTDPSQWFPAIGAALGWVEVSDAPSYDPDTQYPPAWNGSSWDSPVDIRAAELIRTQRRTASSHHDDLIERRADKLAKRGDTLGAIKLLQTKGR